MQVALPRVLFLESKKGFRVLLPASSGTEAGRVPSALGALGAVGALRCFRCFFGGGRGELIVSFPGVPCPECSRRAVKR